MTFAAGKEKGMQWWVRYVVVPVLSGGAFVAILTIVLPMLLEDNVTVVGAQPIQNISSEGTRTEIGQAGLNPSSLLISEQDFLGLDRNKYYKEEDLQIAVFHPPSEYWEIESSNAISTVGIRDIPAIGSGLELYKAIFQNNQPIVFSIRQREGHEIILYEDSSIDSIAMNLNYLDDFDYFKASMQTSQEIMAMFGIDSIEEIPDEDLEEIRTIFSDSFEATIYAKLPVEKSVHSGIYVMPISADFLQDSFLRNWAPSASLLDMTMNYLNLSGFFSGNAYRNLYINQDLNQTIPFASFTSSVLLENVEIDGKKTDSYLNNVGFIVEGEERALYILLIYLGTDDLTVFQTLEMLLDSLRFTG